MGSFNELGITKELCKVCSKLGWLTPTPIQQETIPLALQDKDIVGLAVTGSGKTAAFALPILHNLLKKPKLRFFALVLSPTRELAIQIKDQFDDLGSSFGLQVGLLVGGMNLVQQAVEIGKHPHIVIATPGRLIELLKLTKGFNLQAFKYLVLDEADRMLDLGFEEEVDQILRALPCKRRNMLFSATMTSKVNRLKRTHLKDFARVEVSSEYETSDTLKEFMIHVDIKEDISKHMYLYYVLSKLKDQYSIIFCTSCPNTLKISLLLRKLKFKCVPLSGDMTQEMRLKALNKFKSKECNILVATDVASRGLDIPDVDLVINYDVPSKSKVYIHRVGRTARAGKSGTAITFVLSGDVLAFKRIEEDLGYVDNKCMPCYIEEEETEEVKKHKNLVEGANRLAKAECKEKTSQFSGKKKRRTTDDDREDTEQSLGYRKKLKRKKE